jgi:hypothetical protein
MLVTRKQKGDAKGRGDIRAWLGSFPITKPPRGRPKKKSLLDDEKAADGGNQAKKQSAELSLDALPPVTAACKKQQGMYDKWRTDPAMFDLLKAAVINACTANACAANIALLTRILRSTMRRHKAAFEEVAKEHRIPLSDVTCQMIFPKAAEYGTAPLLSEDDCKFLADIAILRDLRNNDMTRSEMITMVMELSQCVSRKQAENHYGYLVQNCKLSGLKRGGKVVTAQKTTTKRSQITVEQQLRWHTAVDFALAEQQRQNLPAEEFDKVKEHFLCNMDESSLLASDGTVKVIWAAFKSKTEKILEDCRASITV